MRRPWDTPLGLSIHRDGFLGIGGSSAKTDRGNQLASTQGEWNVFNQGLGLSNQQNTTGQSQQATGQGDLSSATDYWKNLLTAGRTQTAANAAPAINATVAGADASKVQGAQFGSGRSGGTAATNAEAGTQTQSSVDNIINSNLVGGKQAAASGLAGVGSTELATGSTSISQALQSLGLSGTSANSILENSTQSSEFDQKQNAQTGAAAGQVAGQLLDAWLFA